MQEAAKVEAIAQILIIVIVSYRSEVLHPIISTWKNTCSIMKIHSKETRDKSSKQHKMLLAQYQLLLRTWMPNGQTLEE